MSPRLSAPALAWLLGSALLLAVYGALDQAQLPIVALGALGIGSLLLLGRGLSSFSAHRRLAAFTAIVEPLLPPRSRGVTDPRELGCLPWFINLSTESDDHPIIAPARAAVFARIDPASLDGRELLRALRDLRPHAPIAGVILAVPADRLLTQPSAVTTQQSAALARHLMVLHTALGVRFPVTITITHARCLRGFQALAEAAAPADTLGWSNSLPLDSATPITSFDDAICAIRDHVRRARLHLLTQQPAKPIADELFPLPDKVAHLAAPLRSLAAAIAPFHSSHPPPPFFFPGVSLTSARTLAPGLLTARLLPQQRLVCAQGRPARPLRHAPVVAAAVLLAPALALSLTLILRAATAAPVRATPRAVATAAPIPSAPRHTPRRPALGAAALNQTRFCRTHALQLAHAAATTVGRARVQIPRLLAASLSTPQAVRAVARDLASHVAAPDLPTLPCTPAPALDPAFRPDLARALFADFEFLAPTLSGPALDEFNTAFASYASDYVLAWSAVAQPRVTAAPWPQLRRAISAINPARVNRDAHDMYFTVVEALALVPGSLGQDGPIDALRAALRRETTALDLPWFDQACTRARDKWASLDPAQPRAAIIRLSRARFQADYLEVYAEPQQPGSTYWSDLILAALSSTADSAAPAAAAAAFIQNTRAFPLCSTASRTLQPADLSAARDYASAIIRTGLASSIPDDALPLSRGVSTDFPRINEQLARLVGQSAFEGEARDQWAYRLRAVLNFLDHPQSCALVLLDPSEQVPIDGATPAAVQVPQFDLVLGQDHPLGPFYTDRAADPGIRFELPGPDLTFTFRSPQGVVATVHLPEPWNAVKLLHQSGAIIDDQSDPTGRLVKAPLTFTDAGGQRWCYWIGLRFERPPPALAQWPSDADWPD